MSELGNEHLDVEETPIDPASLKLAKQEEAELFETPEVLLQSVEGQPLNEVSEDALRMLVRTLGIAVKKNEHDLAVQGEELRGARLKNDGLEAQNSQLKTETKTRTVLCGVTVGCLVPAIIAAGLGALWFKVAYPTALSDDLIKSFFTVLLGGLIALPLAVFGYYFFTRPKQ